jgi:hypothetical protein
MVKMTDTKEIRGTCRFDAETNTLWIGMRGKWTCYRVYRVASDVRVADPAFALVKTDGTTYHCGMTDFGWTCDCGHMTFVGDKIGEPCKHLRSILAIGLPDKIASLPLENFPP